MSKPHKGRIERWRREWCPGGLEFLIVGHLVGHPDYEGREGHTSAVMAYDETAREIETRNSRYTLTGDPTE